MGTVQLPSAAMPNTMTAKAPTAAPDDTPMTPGSASGLPNTPCISAPAQPSAAPTRTASRTRGKRTSQSASSPRGAVGIGSTSMPNRWRIEPRTWSTGTCSWPTPAATTHAMMSAMPNPAMVSLPRLVTRGQPQGW